MTISDETQPMPAPTQPYQTGRADRTVRVGTVVWGFLLIGIAAIFFVASQFDLGRFNPAVVAVWAVLGIGVLAVVGGLAGALFRRR